MREEALREIMDEMLARIREILRGGLLSEEEFEEALESVVLDESWALGYRETRQLMEMVRARTRSYLGILDRYVRDENVKEIMVNGTEDIFLETKEGITRAPEKFWSVVEIEEIMRNIAASVHREINEMHPILDARLEDGSRVNAVYKNVALDGPVITIRKFSKEHITMDRIAAQGGVTKECQDVLRCLVQSGYNIFISGGTSSGKTTFLNALADYIPAQERVIVIEDSRELSLTQIENIVQMECHNANALGQGGVSMDALIRSSLRMRPDRIIVGEVRGKEVSEMLQAMNTGHDGCISTGHGNSVSGMLRRLESMYLMTSEVPIDAIRGQMVEGIDILLHMRRLPNGARVLTELQELCGYVEGQYVLNPLFLRTADGLQRTENGLKDRTKMEAKGVKPVHGL